MVMDGSLCGLDGGRMEFGCGRAGLGVLVDIWASDVVLVAVEDNVTLLFKSWLGSFNQFNVPV